LRFNILILAMIERAVNSKNGSFPLAYIYGVIFGRRTKRTLDSRIRWRIYRRWSKKGQYYRSTI